MSRITLESTSVVRKGASVATQQLHQLICGQGCRGGVAHPADDSLSPGLPCGAMHDPEGVAVLHDVHLVAFGDPMTMAQLSRNRHLSLAVQLHLTPSTYLMYYRIRHIGGDRRGVPSGLDGSVVSSQEVRHELRNEHRLGATFRGGPSPGQAGTGRQRLRHRLGDRHAEDADGQDRCRDWAAGCLLY